MQSQVGNRGQLLGVLGLALILVQSKLSISRVVINMSLA